MTKYDLLDCKKDTLLRITTERGGMKNKVLKLDWVYAPFMDHTAQAALRWIDDSALPHHFFWNDELEEVKVPGK